MLDASSSWRVWMSSPTLPPPWCWVLQFPCFWEELPASVTILGQFLCWWLTSKQFRHLFSDMQCDHVEWAFLPQTRHRDGQDQQEEWGLNGGATCGLVRSSTLSSILSTHSNAPVSFVAACVVSVMASGSDAFTAVLSPCTISAWLMAAVATWNVWFLRVKEAAFFVLNSLWRSSMASCTSAKVHFVIGLYLNTLVSSASGKFPMNITEISFEMFCILLPCFCRWLSVISAALLSRTQ